MLTARQVEVLRAVVNRIIPADEFPGGWEVGVGDYILRQLQGDLKQMVSVYGRGLDGLDAEARARHGVGFVELDAEAQDVLLADIEQGKTQAQWETDAQAFFKIVVEHAQEGFYSDPSNGGNRGGVAWRMIGFEVTG
jgi:hypothetical protein